MARKKARSEGTEVDPTATPPENGHAEASPPDVADELSLSPPPPPPPPEATVIPLEERISRLEQALTQLSDLQATGPRQPERGVQVKPEPAAPTVLSRAQALVDAGRQLLPALTLGAGKASPASRLGLLRDVVHEMQAIYYMYADPRYRMTWFGRVVPPTLLVMFLTCGFWLPLVACGLLSLVQWAVQPVVQLTLCYALFKILGQEARIYRETAPDLPTTLRQG